MRYILFIFSVAVFLFLNLLHLLSFKTFQRIFDNQLLMLAEIEEGREPDYGNSPLLYGVSSQCVLSLEDETRIYFVDYTGFIEGLRRGLHTRIACISTTGGKEWRLLDLFMKDENGRRIPFSGVDPHVIEIDDGFRAFFVIPEGGGDPARLMNSIRSATSRDGIEWQLDSSILLQGRGIVDPDVVLYKGLYHLYYTKDSKNGGGIFLATSKDGKNFDTKGKIVTLGSVSSAISKDDEILLFYQRYRRGIFMARSRDGLNFIDEEVIIPLKFAMSPSVVTTDRGYLIYFILNPPSDPFHRIIAFTARAFKKEPLRYPFHVPLEIEAGG